MSSIKQLHFPHSCAYDKDWVFHGGIKIASIIFKLTMSNIFFPAKCTNIEIYHAFKLCFYDWKWRIIFLTLSRDLRGFYIVTHIYYRFFFWFFYLWYQIKKKKSSIILLFWAILLSLRSFKQQKTKWNICLIIP